VHQVGNQYIVNSWCTVRKTSSYKKHVFVVSGVASKRMFGLNMISEERWKLPQEQAFLKFN